MQETIIETKECKKCWISFDITDKDMEFYKKVSPIIQDKIYQIPTPTLCPTCRQQRRVAWRNERNFFRRKCDLTWKSIISIYSPDKPYKVYEHNKWRTDECNNIDYGQDFDFSKPFFQQYNELLQKVPRQNLYIQNVENSDYSNGESDIKNCYLTIWWHWNENCMYGTYYIKSTNCIDNYWLFDSENSMENVISYNLYKCFYLQYSKDCNNCKFGIKLEWCQDCLWCIGLQNAKYCIFNKQYSKEEYFQKLEELELSNSNNLEKFKKEFKKFAKKQPQQALNIINSENCVWNDIFNSKNCYDSFSLEDCEDAKYCFILWIAKDNMDVTSAGVIDFSYEMTSWGMKSYHCLFSMYSYECRDIIYSDNCHYSQNLFGCIWLRQKKYCILNKQYTQEEYEKLVPQIIEHMKTTWEWGEFFPASISPFGYNESVANDHTPLNKKEAIKQGFKWQENEYPINVPEWMARIEAKDLPEVKDLNDKLEKKIINTAIICKISWKPYRITKQELEFYKKHNIPLPRKHQDVRHMDRIKLINQMTLCDSKCKKCWTKIKTSCNAIETKTIYCENCYNKEIY